MSGRRSFLRLFSSSIVAQAALSGANLLVGLILLRHQSAEQYGYYVLVMATVLLLTGLQNAYIGPPLVIRLHQSDPSTRGTLVGGLLREQGRLIGAVAILALASVVLAYASGRLAGPIAGLVLAGIAAAALAAYREFFRTMLVVYQRPGDVLPCDLVFVGLLIGGAWLARYAPWPAAATVLSLALAAAVGGSLLARALWRHEPWQHAGTRSVLREFAPIGLWSLLGSGIHWAFTQGYTYLVAALLDLPTVAAIAATRLLLMPVNLLSQGIVQVMNPAASRWLHLHGAARVYRRLLLLCAGLFVMIAGYIAVMWLLRDWIFATILKKSFADRDALLLLWSAIFLLTTLRDQLASLLTVRGKLRQMTTLTIVCATLSLAASYLAIGQFGAVGALAGILLGESISIAGVWVLTHRESLVPGATAVAG